MRKNIGIVTTSRADFGLLYPIIKELQSSDDFSVKVIATGMHLLREFGYTIQYVKKKCKNVDEVNLFIDNINAYNLIKSIGIGFMSFGDYLKYNNFDIVIVLGDRTELIVPVYSAMIYNIPICHIFGGDSIENYVTYDNNIRHCITKLSNIHLTATKEHAERIKKLGEEEWRIFNVGSPAIDYIFSCNYLSKRDLQEKFYKIDFKKPYCILTFHPVPSEMNEIEIQIDNIIHALNINDIQVICTKPNNDLGSDLIMDRIVHEHNINKKFLLVNSISQEEYYSLLKFCAFMIGNSSSGVLESSSFNIPSINIGTRQLGRIKGVNVIDSDYSVSSINNMINMCIYDNEFIRRCKICKSPYGDGQTSLRVVKIFKNILNDKQKLLVKKITY